MAESAEKLVVVTGGGTVARTYIDVYRKAGGNESVGDILGIAVSRLNALLLSAMLGSGLIVPSSVEEVVSRRDRVIVMGGLQPGQSTTSVAAEVAEAISASLLVITAPVDGIYTSDPSTDPSARLLDKVTVAELRQMFGGMGGAGEYRMLDPVTLGVLERSGIRAVVVNGKPPENILRAIRGEHVGTIIEA